MSSQATFGQWQNHEAHTPPPNATNGGIDEGVTVRPMRLKVLYTFDDQNKTNCLARWPHILQIQTITMEEGAVIGVIELKTCIQAIVECSPELVARIDKDYTVYAYDFSEYDNPLVGQGMLSKVLRAASPMPDVPAQQSPQLITGRVCKNILGLFTNGVKETLEVKLRLVPVPTALQNEYQNTMEKYREMNKVIPPPGFDPNEWNNFIQSNPNFSQMNNKSSVPPNPNPHQRDGMSMEVVNQLLSPSMQQQPNTDPFNQAPNVENTGNVGGGSKNGVKAKKTASRPSSRASVKRPRKPKAAATGGNTSGYEECTDGDDGPATKKRAKITKADSNAKSSFGSANDSLRVAASTASSLRLFRPIAMSPAPTAGGHLQEIPRAPTPVPNLPNQNLARNQLPAQSGLRRDSFASQAELPRQHISPYADLQQPEDELRYSIESADPSPERNPSPGDTPPDICSSPPVMRTRPPSLIRSSPPCPSSPVLPQMPRTDSGFMSGSLEDLFGEDEEPERLVEDDDVKIVATYEKRQAAPLAHTQSEISHQVFTIEEVIPGPIELLPTRMPIHEVSKPTKAPVSKPPKPRGGSVLSEDGQSLPPLKKGSRAPSCLPTRSQLEKPEFVVQRPPIGQQAAPEPQQGIQQVVRQPSESRLPPVVNAPLPLAPNSRMMVRTASMGSLTLPEVSASDPVLPQSSLQRSQTWSEAPPDAISEAPIPPLPNMLQMQTMPPMVDSSNSGVAYSRTFNAKKAAIKQRLEMAVMNGEMPPYCSNCGAIETPTWRKAWYQEVLGAPGYYEYSDEPGRVTAIVILTRDSDGNPTSYQLIKKYLLKEESIDDFKEFLLCNPCGIWMSKYKTQRPPDKWESNAGNEKKAPEKKRPQQRPSRPKKPQTTNMSIPTSEANFPQSDVNFPPSEANFPQSEAHFPQSEAYFPQAEASGPQMGGVSPTDTTGMLQQDQTQQTERQRSTSARPTKRLNAMTSNAASAALRRAIQSSPARWQGTRRSPINIEDEMGSTRRLLFPSPRKDDSPKVLGEVTTNVVHIATEFHPPKEQMIEAADKENCPPAMTADDGDAELFKLFEEEMARPTTPVQKTPPANGFKTPTRPTPNHRPITRSVSRSVRSAKSPGQLLHLTPSRTPYSSARRRSPRHNNRVFESPFTATLNQLMSEANNHAQSPSRNGNGNSMELDFENLPDLPIGGQHSNVNANFNLENFFSTDVPMPSSPPRLFHLYEDPMGNINWSDFSAFETKNLENSEDSQEVVVKTEPEESPQKSSSGKEAGRESSQ